MTNDKTYIVLLRGVMPSGKNSIKMARLREIIEGAGFREVKTYIQSGNVILRSEREASEVSHTIATAIRTQTEADLPIIVKTPDEISQVLTENPFGEGYLPERVFYTLTNDALDTDKATALAREDFGDGTLAIGQNALYMYIPSDASRSRLSNVFLEKKLALTLTTRNGNTLRKLLELSAIHTK